MRFGKLMFARAESGTASRAHGHRSRKILELAPILTILGKAINA